MHPALTAIAEATKGGPFEGQLWLVGGAVRDDLLGRVHSNDFDIVLEGSSGELARLLHERGVSSIAPVTYERFGTAMVHVEGTNVEIVTARRESYDDASRKPDVEPATLEEDALRRDFTVNALMRNLHTQELRDPLGMGLHDLGAKVLRTPVDPKATFYDDPLRMLRAVRFRWQLGFEPVDGLYEAIHVERERLRIISLERIRDEFLKMLMLEGAAEAVADLMELGLLSVFAPELVAMRDVDQGSYHHLDVWNHSLLVLKNVGKADLTLRLAALLHDVGKPPTRFVDDDGDARFFGHETVGADLTRTLLKRLKLSNEQIEPVALLVRNHMRLGSAPVFTPSAARRLIRDLDDRLEDLLNLVEADANALKRGVRALDLQPIRDQIKRVSLETPRHELESPLTGEEIMSLMGLTPGPEVGRLKQMLVDKVLEGELRPGDKEGAMRLLKESGSL